MPTQRATRTSARFALDAWANRAAVSFYCQTAVRGAGRGPRAVDLRGQPRARGRPAAGRRGASAVTPPGPARPAPHQFHERLLVLTLLHALLDFGPSEKKLNYILLSFIWITL